MQSWCVFTLITLSVYGLCSGGIFPAHVIVDFSSEMKEYTKLGDKYYWINTDSRLNWFAAWLTCREHSGFLASFANVNELDTLHVELTNRNISHWLWIDGMDLSKQGDYRWYSNAQAVKSELFDVGQPDNPGKEPCLSLWKDNHRINNLACDQLVNFICELDPNQYKVENN